MTFGGAAGRSRRVRIWAAFAPLIGLWEWVALPTMKVR